MELKEDVSARSFHRRFKKYFEWMRENNFITKNDYGVIHFNHTPDVAKGRVEFEYDGRAKMICEMYMNMEGLIYEKDNREPFDDSFHAAAWSMWMRYDEDEERKSLEQWFNTLDDQRREGIASSSGT